MKGKFFYNYTATNSTGMNKFVFDILTIKVDDTKDIVDEAFKEICGIAKEAYPDAVINLKASNAVK